MIYEEVARDFDEPDLARFAYVICADRIAYNLIVGYFRETKRHTDMPDFVLALYESCQDNHYHPDPSKTLPMLVWSLKPSKDLFVKAYERVCAIGLGRNLIALLDDYEKAKKDSARVAVEPHIVRVLDDRRLQWYRVNYQSAVRRTFRGLSLEDQADKIGQDRHKLLSP